MPQSLVIDQPIIFLGGIHAVGKTTFCQELMPFFEHQHVSASQLIKHHSSDKRVQNVDTNQDILIQALSSEIATASPIILDGHFCIQNKKGEIENIAFSTFKKISPIFLILLTLPVNILFERWQVRGYKKPITFLERFQNQEYKHAQAISERLDIPLITIDPMQDMEAVFPNIQRLVS